MPDDLSWHARAWSLESRGSYPQPSTELRWQLIITTQTHPANTSWALGEKWGRRPLLTKGNQEWFIGRLLARLMGAQDSSGRDEQSLAGGSTVEGMGQKWRPGSSLTLVDSGDYNYDHDKMESQESDWSQKRWSQQGWRRESLRYLKTEEEIIAESTLNCATNTSTG